MHIRNADSNEQIRNKSEFHQINTCNTGRKNVDKVVFNFYYFVECELNKKKELKSYVIFNSALLSLSKVVMESNTSNELELLVELTAARDILMMNLCTEEFNKRIISEYGITNVSVASLCQIFVVSLLNLIMVEGRNSFTETELSEFKMKLSDKTNNFINNLTSGTQKIMNLSMSLFTKDRTKILTFGYSEIIEMLLDKAHEKYNKQYSIFIVVPNKDDTEEFSLRNELIYYHHKNISEWKMRMKNKGISVKLLPIDSVYNAMNTVDFVLLKPECVLKSGSAIGISGTAIISSIAKSVFYKPVYFVAHATKFVNAVPLEMNINAVVSELTYQSEKLISCPVNSIFDLSESSHITMFFTDIGVITPQNIAFEAQQFFS